MVCILQ
jgi:hypothetical protein